MKLDLTFNNTGDVISFEVKHNHKLIEWFVDKADKENVNSFLNNDNLGTSVDQKLADVHWALSKTNEVYWLLCDNTFPQSNNLTDYIDQAYLNRQHKLWVDSQHIYVDIDKLRFSNNINKASAGRKLHDMYPDNIRQIPLAQAMQKLGYIYPYEEVNMTVHRLETIFSRNIEYSGIDKWAGFGFENPFVDTMVSNLDRVNFSFGYTFVGRQYYNKWQNWDTELDWNDQYNYESLEWSFHVNLDRPQTNSWSPEFLKWAKEKNVTPVATQIPIANIIDLEKNLTQIRKIVYNNAKQNNSAKLSLN